MGAMLCSVLASCAEQSVGKQAAGLQDQAMRNIAAQHSPEVKPVVTTVDSAWLMGDAIAVAKPASPLLSSPILYHPAQRVSLADIAAYITLSKGLVVDTAEVMQTMSMGGVSGMQGMAGSLTAQQAPVSGPAFPAQTSLQAGVGMTGAGMPLPQNMQSMSISYEGTVSGLLDIAASKAAVWWRFDEGKVVFYRTETETFYLPAISRKSLGDSTITTATANSGTGATSSGGTNTTASSGATITSDYGVDMWGDLEKTAKAVGSGAQVAANASAGSLTVTGTPAQVRAVEHWVKALTQQLSQQVAITVQVYRVKIAQEDTYNWDPDIVFRKAAGTIGYNVSSPTALVPVSGNTPLSIAASVLTPTATQGTWGQYTGSQAAFQALSTLGKVTETLQQTMVTLNGEPAPIQIANQQGYLASSSTLTQAVGGAITTYTPGTVTTGFTATFIPRVLNGRIVLSMTMTNSTLLGITTVGSTTNGIQTTNVDLSTFQQSVSLTPGDALLLSGVQQDNGSMNNEGVGSPVNAVLGGGVNNQIGNAMIAIVVSAKVL
jgi:type IVB pilus formation R64 PilN family outer membrane protein